MQKFTGTMKLEYIFLTGLFSVISGVAYATPTLNVCTIASCATGYYLSGGVCTACVSPGTSIDHNTGGITSCYIPSGTTMTDSYGTYTYTSNCSYSS
ncbi:MAG TPA: hypothetical protein PKJ33_02565 [Alphaproteobacteria bacterium]|nr:hypothetical protein [Alphaproteobacteria bacterium]